MENKKKYIVVYIVKIIKNQNMKQKTSSKSKVELSAAPTTLNVIMIMF